MADFKPVVMEKDGKPSRIAYSPSEQVQFEWDGYTAGKEAPKKLQNSASAKPAE